jgi:hypothetical protein
MEPTMVCASKTTATQAARRASAAARAGVRPNSHTKQITLSPCGRYYLSHGGQWVPKLAKGDRVAILRESRRRDGAVHGTVVETLGDHVSGTARVRYRQYAANAWTTDVFPIQQLRYEPTPHQLAKITRTLRQSWQDDDLRQRLYMPTLLLGRGSGAPDGRGDATGNIRTLAVADCRAAIRSEANNS